jgi:ankyrin repeat protein
LHGQILVPGSSDTAPSAVVLDSSTSKEIVLKDTSPLTDSAKPLLSGLPQAVHPSSMPTPAHNSTLQDSFTSRNPSFNDASWRSPMITKPGDAMNVEVPETRTIDVSGAGDHLRTNSKRPQSSPSDPVTVSPPSQPTRNSRMSDGPPKCKSRAHIKELFEQILVAASEVGVLDVVRALVQSGINIDIDATDESNCQWTALTSAITEGHCDTALFLLQHGATCSADDLISASRRGLLAVVEEIVVRKGVDINAIDEYNGSTALTAAITEGQCDTALLLLQHGAACSAGALTSASRRGLLAVVQELVKQMGIDIDASDNFYGTALRSAIRAGHDDIALFLLQHGVTYSVDDLVFASCLGRLAIVQEIVEKGGVNINAAGPLGWRALSIATDKGHRDVAVFLLQHGATYTTDDLLSACRLGRLGIVEEIVVRAGAATNSSNHNGSRY